MANKLIITQDNLHLLSSLPTTLEVLDCRKNNLSSLPDLPPRLKVLYCSNNNLTSLPPLPPTLKELYCSHNNLTSLPSLPSTLKYFYCRYNNLTLLPLLPSTLEYFYCSGNKLPDWYYTSTIQEIHNRQIVEKLLLLRKKAASRLIQKAWTRYWYHPNSEGISRYATYMSHLDLNILMNE